MFASKDLFFTKPSGGYQISRSVRIRGSSGAYLSRTTVASPTNNKIFTASMWVKRGIINDSVFETLLGGASAQQDTIGFGANTNNGGDSIQIRDSQIGGYSLITTPLFRDPSSWYHIVLAVDTTQATAANRVKLYVNSVQVTFSTATYPTQNYVFEWNAASTGSTIGRRSTASSLWNFDGYLTEINFIDGQALTPSSFGQTNSVTGVWQPIKYTGTYGTNGFYLNFSDNSAATAAAIGKDYSGNANNWTPNNISVTAGVTYDSMIDVPTLYADGGNGRGNYLVLNPLSQQVSTQLSITNGNLTCFPTTSAAWAAVKSSLAVSSGKWYVEATIRGVPASSGADFGFVGVDLTTSANWDIAGAYVIGYNGIPQIFIYNNGSLGGYFPSGPVAGDVMGIALDLDNGKIWYAQKNTWISGSPSAGTSPSATGIVGTYTIGVDGLGSSSVGWDVNFGQRPFTYTPPTGFVALNTQNLPTPTISNGANYMAATTYTGTGSSLTIANTVNGISFYPDFVWVKGRSGATDHALYDSVRGTTKDLASNTTAAETTQATGLTAFGSTGFTVGALAKMNTNAATYVGWQWQAGAGSSSSNTSGSITSTVSVNATAGFSVVTYTGTGSNATVGHGLGVAPQMVIVKNRGGVYSWLVYHKFMATSSPATWYMSLNQTSAASNGANIWINDPTSTVFTVSGTYPEVNASTNTYVAYCFAPVTGYSKFGSYTGNGSTDGPFVYLGFRPRWILIKRSSTYTAGYGDWYLYDTSRMPYNVTNTPIYPDTSAAESGANSAFNIDILSNGFKVLTTYQDLNLSGTVYIFAAFAEVPFRYANAR